MPERLKPPDPPLRGAIVKLRPVSAEDRAAVYSACQDAEIQRWTSVPSRYSADDARSYIKFSKRAWRDGSTATFSILDHESSEFLGLVDLRLYEDAVAEVAYWVKAEARGRGVATEAVRLVSRWAFDQLRMARVQLGMHPENLASQRVAMKAGFQREGVLRSLREIKGERVDQVFFSMLPEDVASSQPPPSPSKASAPALAKRDALDPSPAHRGDLEGDLELRERTVSREEDLGGPAQAALLLAPDCFRGVTEARPAPHLHLAEDESLPATNHDVQFVPAGPDVRS
jgi:RimJ/RimL family protein N-acetyltransferase